MPPLRTQHNEGDTVSAITTLDYAALARALNIPDLERRLKAKSRSRRLVDVRRALSAILVEQGYSVREIGRELCRPHSTVVHFVQTHWNLCATDGEYRGLVEQLRETMERWR
jgi:chromosomal replication initiation ATPase DnaA